MKDKLSRFGVSLDSDLLKLFDREIEKQHFASRSEAIRDLIRRELVAEEWEDPQREVVGAISMVYDHHVRGLTERLLELQHGFGCGIIATMHVHLDHHNCMEVLVARGTGATVRDLAGKIRGLKGVKHATLSMTTKGTDI